MSVMPRREPAGDGTPYALLWTVGIVAAVLAIAAFVLWGTGGAGLLLDFVAALCA